MLDRTIKEVKIYEEKGFQFLSIRYLIEDDTSVKEFHLPKVRLPIEYADLNHEYNQLGSNTRYDTVNLVLPGKELEVQTGDATFHVDGRIEKYKEVKYACKVIEEKTKDMTIEEIEKKLGHKIKIVNKKEN